MTLETDSEMTIMSIETVHDKTADRFYAVSTGENALIITVKADAESMNSLSAHFDRMAETVEFTAVNEETSVE